MPASSKFNDTLSRLAANYGMGVALILLCIVCSLATISDQLPTGKRAADSIAAQVSDGASALVVGRSSGTDPELVQLLAERFEAKKVTVVERVVGGPPDARAALERLAAAGTKVDVIAASNEAGGWAVFENLNARFPAIGTAQVVTPQKSRWPTFLTVDNLSNVASQVVIYAVLAIGMSLVIITGGIDLSVGSVVAFTAVVTAIVIRSMGGTDASLGTMLLASGIGIVAGGGLGLVSGLLVTACQLPPFIATLGMMLVARGLAFTLTDGLSVSQMPDAFTFLGRGTLAGIPVAVLLMVGLYVIAHVVMSTTVFGRYVYATGGNREAARLSGVRVSLILVATYVISGLAAGLCGVILTSQLKSGDPKTADMYELYAIAAVVVGGTSLAGGSGKILATLIGALIIAVIQNGMNLVGISAYNQRIVLGIVIVAAVSIDTFRRSGRFAFWRGWSKRMEQNTGETLGRLSG